GTLRQMLDDHFQLRGRTITLSARVRASAEGAVRVRLVTTGAAVNLDVVSNYITQANAYETLTVGGTIPPDATAIFCDVRLDAKSATLYTDNAMLVIGASPVAFAPLHPADEQARCERYYQQLR